MPRSTVHRPAPSIRIIICGRTSSEHVVNDCWTSNPGEERQMDTVIRRTVTAACFALFTAAAYAQSEASRPAQAQAAVALTGRVSSAEEGAMEGVVVSGRKDGSTISISVVTDAQGRFAFPAARLEPGHYALKARAAGYEIDAAQAADVAAGSVASADIKLKKVKNLSAHLTNAEWMMSMPGTDEQKRFLLNCNGCHTIERIMKSAYDADGFMQIFQRMAGYYPGSTPLKPQRLAGKATRDVERGGSGRKTAEWLATVNLSQQQTWAYPLKTEPRLTGRSTRVIITEYDLPNPLIQPHDVVLDREDNPWVGVMYQSAIAKFDKKSEKFRMWSTPKEWDTDAGQLGHIAIEGTQSDNKVWIKNSDGGHIYRLDLVSDRMENLGAFKDPKSGKRIGTYGIHSDAQNNAYLLDFAAGNIVRIDAKTKNAVVYPTPTPDSRPRRGRVDHEGRLWFAEYQGNAIGMFDPKAERITEWKVPTPWSAPYDAVAGKNGEAWTGSMLTDRVPRLDIKSGQYTEYMLPRPTNIRRVYLDDSKSPGTLWIGSNHGASIVKVEPLD